MVTPLEVFLYLIAAIVGVGLGMFASLVLLSVLTGQFKGSDLHEYWKQTLTFRR